MLAAGATASVALTGDEAQTILRDGVAHLGIGADRYAVGRAVEQQLRPDVFLLDDGFQHARLHRDLDIVVLDGLDPFGGGFVFPAGRLREPLSALRRADVVAITRAEGRRFDAILDVLGPAKVVLLETKVVCWVDARTGSTLPLDAFHSKPYVAVCGLGNPDAFRQTLLRIGYNPVKFKTFPDHHVYRASDLDDVNGLPILTTEKDAVKLVEISAGSVYWLSIQVDVQPLLSYIHESVIHA